MATLYSNLKGGSITDAPLSNVATTINSAAFADLPAVTGSDTMWITLDPAGANGAPEIVSVTAHTAAATSVTVVRAQQSTTARSHPVSTVWAHSLTTTDIARIATLEGQLDARPPFLVYHGTGTQAFTALQTSTGVTIDTEVFDIGTVGAVGSAVLTAPTDGLYVLVLAGSISAGTGEVDFAATTPSANNDPGLTIVAAEERISVPLWLSSGNTMSLRGNEVQNAAATITFDVKLYRIA